MNRLNKILRAMLHLHRNQRSVVGINRRNVELVYPHNARSDYPIADDKLLCKRHLRAAGVPVPKTLAVCEGLFAISSVLEQLEPHGHFVIKPATGSGGDGIMVVGDRIGGGRWRKLSGSVIDSEQITRHLANTVFGVYSKELEDRAFVEKRIVPHRVFHDLWSQGLCDLRIIMLNADPVVAMVRVPTLASAGRANLHQGGIGLAVDLRSGVTTRALHEGRVIERHPESDAQLLGLQMPEWDTMLAISRHVAQSVPLKFLGIDLVVDDGIGPMVLEINARPGLEVQNVHGFGMGHMLRKVD